MLSGTVEFAYICSPLAREPEIVNCQVGHVECFVRENFQRKKGKLEIRQSERRLSSSGVGRRRSTKLSVNVPRVRVIDTGRCEVYLWAFTGG